jgi:ABC-type multidrug transport system fused ATPase/permease subunit
MEPGQLEVLADGTADALRARTAPVRTPLKVLYRHVWRYAAGARARYLAALGLLVGSQLLKLVAPWLAAQAINTLQAGGADSLRRAGWFVAAIFLVYAGAWAMHGPGRILERHVGLRVRAAVSDALYAKLASLPLAWHEVYHSGEVQHRAQQASRALAQFTETQFIYLQNFVNVVGPLGALWLIDHRIGGTAAIGFLLVAAVIVGFDTRLMGIVREENEAERRYTVRWIEFLSNIGTVSALRLQDVSRKLLNERLDRVFVPLRQQIRLNEGKWMSVDLLSIGLTWSLVALYAWQASREAPAAASAAAGGVAIGTLYMVYQYAQQAGGVIGAMATHLQGFARIRTDYASADPIWEAGEREPSLPVSPDWREARAIHLSLVYVRNDGARVGVEDVNLTLRRGERIALIGPSGGGKSTLLRLLAGLYDPRGGVYEIDGRPAPGVKHLGSIATLIPQEADVFEATVRENLTFGAGYPDEAIAQACRLSAFDAVVDALPERLETRISERGFNLSGGQRQRLALARGLLAAGNSSLILLDEPTSALDQVTEAQVFGRLRDALPHTTMIASVHRMSALPHFDRLVLLADGRVVDAGPPDEVLSRQPLLREMVEAGRARGPAALV